MWASAICDCVCSDQWKNMSKALSSAGHSLVAVQANLIDAVWEDRPSRPSTKLIALGLKYTGQHFSMEDNNYTLYTFDLKGQS